MQLEENNHEQQFPFASKGMTTPEMFWYYSGLISKA